ncbi:Transcription and mRNA export factor eny2 [Paramecium bursaria]
MNQPRGAQDFINQRTSMLAMKLKETGEDARLEEYLRQKLIECRWRDELKDYCKEQIRQKGLEKITIEELTDMLYVRGQATIPNKVKEDLLSRLRQFFEENQI